jgi:hypothetical protein
LNSNCSYSLDKRNLQEQVKKAFCHQKLFWHFTVQTNCSSDLRNFANSWILAWNFKSFSRSIEQFVRTVDQNNFGNKIPFQDSYLQQQVIFAWCSFFDSFLQILFDILPILPWHSFWPIIWHFASQSFEKGGRWIR